MRSDRLTHEAELTEQNERLEQFASVVSHDLRSPLQVIQARVGLAQATHDSEELEITLDALGRMNTMIDDLLTLARCGADLGEIQAVSLSALVGECSAPSRQRRRRSKPATNGSGPINRGSASCSRISSGTRSNTPGLP